MISGGKNILGSFSFPVQNRPKKVLICHERAIPRRIMRERVCSVFILQVVTPPPRPKIHTIRHYPFPLVYCTRKKMGGAVSGFLPFPSFSVSAPVFPHAVFFCCTYLSFSSKNKGKCYVCVAFFWPSISAFIVLLWRIFVLPPAMQIDFL